MLCCSCDSQPRSELGRRNSPSMEVFPSDWQVFLGSVPGAGADEGVLIGKLQAAGWALPLNLVQADASDVLDGLEVSGPQRAFVRRAVLAATKLSAKIEAQGVAASQEIVPLTQASQSQPELLASMQSLLGTESSALMVADAIASGVERPNVTELMAAAKLEEVIDEFCPANEVFTAISADTTIAKKKQLTPFTYVELTNSAMLPDFLPPEAIGGKTFLPGTDDCLNNYTGNITQLSAALKSLTSAPRCFRNITQWSIAFTRYAVAAIAVGQVTWPWYVMHQQMILRIATEESPLVAILYDEISRKQWARRAAKGDKTLALMTETSAKSLSTLELARSRVKLVAKAAGLRDNVELGGPASSTSHFSDAEAALSKQVAAANQVQRQAEAAMNKLQNQRGQGGGGGSGNWQQNSGQNRRPNWGERGKGQQFQHQQGLKRKNSQQPKGRTKGGGRRR